MAKVEDIRSYAFGSNDSFVLDANIWLCLYGPVAGRRRRSGLYSSAFKRMMDAGSSLLFDGLVISEFINRSARLQYKGPARDFKSFRNSTDFAPIAAGIAADVRRIGGYASPMDTPLSTLDMDAIIDEYEAGSRDFNDQVMAETCRAKGVRMITDDADFASLDVEIVTGNTKLI